MKISKIYFVHPVHFKGGPQTSLNCEVQQCDVEFGSGIVLLKDRQGVKETVGVFTSNVRFFTPVLEAAAPAAESKPKGKAKQA